MWKGIGIQDNSEYPLITKYSPAGKDKLTNIFAKCRDLLTEDGSLWIVLGDTRRKYGKLMIPHRLALNLIEKEGYTFREDIIWYKKNNISSSSKDNLSQAYEVILFLSKNEKCFVDMSKIRVFGNEAREGRNKTPPLHMIQYGPKEQDKEKIQRIKKLFTMQNLIHYLKNCLQRLK